MKIRVIEKNKKPVQRVAAYCRVSTGDKVQETSLETQQESYIRLIESREGWQLAGIYADPGQSGLSVKKRSGFQRMMDDAMDGKIDLIITKSISRFSRNVVDFQRAVCQLRERNIPVYFEKENLSTTDAEMDMYLSVLSIVAQNESKAISERIRWTLHSRYQQGQFSLGNNRVLGYDAGPDGRPVPNGDAWVIRYIFDAYSQGQSYAAISRELARMGARRLRSGKPFTAHGLQSILSNEIYVGDRLLQKQAPIDYLTKRPVKHEAYDSFYCMDTHEGIVDRVTWRRVQERRKACLGEEQMGVHRKAQSHPLYGSLFCGCCGSPYRRRMKPTGRRIDGKAECVAVWCCREREKGRGGNGCRARNVREDEVMRVVGGRGRLIVVEEGFMVMG